MANEWNIPPWKEDKLSAKDRQEIALAEHAEAYIKQEQRERARGARSGSISRKNYDTNKSRQEAFQ